MSTSVPMSRVRVRVQGRVQGVYFRASVKESAQLNRVNGWVRNCSDGSVEALLEGETQNVEKVVSFIKKGPQLARVENCEIEVETPSNEFSGFSIERS